MICNVLTTSWHFSADEQEIDKIVAEEDLIGAIRNRLLLL